MIEPTKVKKGDNRVLINGNPPKEDIRLGYEGNWTALLESHENLLRTIRIAVIELEDSGEGSYSGVMDAKKAIEEADALLI